MRHGRDMDDELRSLDAASRRLSVELDRAFRIGLLDLDHLQKESERPRHRPRTVDSPLKRDEIVQSFAYLRALHPQLSRKETLYRVGKLHGVGRTLVEKALHDVDPQRKRNIETAASEFALMYGAPRITKIKPPT
jgi:hypothetical protein